MPRSTIPAMGGGALGGAVGNALAHIIVTLMPTVPTELETSIGVILSAIFIILGVWLAPRPHSVRRARAAAARAPAAPS